MPTKEHVMEAATIKQPRSSALRRFLGTRRGAFVIAAIASALAAIALIAYLNSYKDDVRGGTLPTQVLVADRLIPKGTSGDAVASERLFRPTTLTEADVEPYALADAAALSGKVAARDIYPGQQIIGTDFRAGGDTLRGRLAGAQRALAVPVDQAHGLIGNVRAGDTVDVFATFRGSGADNGILRTIAQNVLVLKTPQGKGVADSGSSSSSSDTQAVVLRVTDAQSARLAFAADNGKVWFALRPPAGGTQSRPSTVTQGSVAAEAGGARSGR